MGAGRQSGTSRCPGSEQARGRVAHWTRAAAHESGGPHKPLTLTCPSLPSVRAQAAGELGPRPPLGPLAGPGPFHRHPQTTHPRVLTP